ncbi:hypothetical protein CXG81DRAFT_15986, partial [Caulochytrium protostelioides]
MSQHVIQNLEATLAELEDLEKKGLFTSAEIKALTQNRTRFEYAVHRRSPKVNDYLRYIEYELNIERLRQKRLKRLGLDRVAFDGRDGSAKGTRPAPRTVSDVAITTRIHNLYRQCLRKFPLELQVWRDYIAWCKQMKSSRALGKIMARAIQTHATIPEFWILAAQHEAQHNNNMHSARILLQRALRINPDQRLLWTEYFKLELMFLARLNKRHQILSGTDASK